jgi:hypothetical protein
VLAADFAPPPNRPGQSAWIPLRHQQQERNLCVPTAAAIVLEYLGETLSPREIKALSLGKTYKPGDRFTDFSITLFRDLNAGLARRGYQWHEGDFPNNAAGLKNGLAAIQRHLDTGLPVLIDTTFGTGHTIVIAGYSIPQQCLFAIDPGRSSRGLRVLGFRELDRIWNSRGVHFNARGADFPERKPDRR